MTRSSSELRVFVVPIMGHWQRRHEQTGTRVLWRDLRLLCTADATILEPKRWNHNWRELAEWIVAEAQGWFRLVTLGYSYGGGWGSQRLTEEVFNESRRKLKAVEPWQALAAPVSRFGFGSRCPLNALNVTRWSGSWRSIELHRSVKRAWWCDQREAAPFGQKGRSKLHEAGVEYGGRFEYPHSAMDELPAYHEAATTLVREALET